MKSQPAAQTTSGNHGTALYRTHPIDPPEGVTWRSYYSAGGARVAEREIMHPAGGPVSQQVFYLIADHLGSTTLITNQSGGVEGRNMYTAWGESRGMTGTLPTSHLYTGQLEAEAGLHFYGARFYDPSIGRFVSADTILPEPGEPISWDRYAYARNNPLRYTDPDGHLPIIPLLIIGGIALMKAIDYGWTAYDAYQSSQVLADPNASQSEKDLAAANLALTATLELAEPDDALPISLPLDDLARRGIINAAESQLDELVEGGAHIIDDLPDNALVCRGGTCTADRFAGGSGVTVNPDGTLSGVSVNSAPGATFEDLSTTFPNGQVGVTTVGDVRAAGGNVVRSPTVNNPYHSTLSGITPSRAERLFTPTRLNPHRLLPK